MKIQRLKKFYAMMTVTSLLVGSGFSGVDALAASPSVKLVKNEAKLTIEGTDCVKTTIKLKKD